MSVLILRAGVNVAGRWMRYELDKEEYNARTNYYFETTDCVVKHFPGSVDKHIRD